jgi:hypothetical protein
LRKNALGRRENDRAGLLAASPLGCRGFHLVSEHDLTNRIVNAPRSARQINLTRELVPGRSRGYSSLVLTPKLHIPLAVC